MAKNSFQDLEIWQHSHELTLKIYQQSNLFPKSEQFGLTSQIRRSASSIPANIAEGFGRKTNKEFMQYLYISLGSLEETRYHLILSHDLHYLPQKEFDDCIDLCDKITAKTLSFIKYLGNKPS
jgi:four helix bundle protein